MMMTNVYSLGGAGSVVMTTVTLDRPFAYSTSTWHDDSCRKNISKFLPVEQRGAESQNVTAVNVDQRPFSDSVNARHEYLLTSPDNSPHLTFSLPGAIH